MYLSLLQDSTPIVPNTVQQMEEYTLSYLADNIGGRVFEPVCVQVLDDSYQTSNNRNRNTKNVFNRSKKNEDEEEDEDVESITLLLLVTYIQKMGPINRRLEFTNSTPSIKYRKGCCKVHVHHSIGHSVLFPKSH